MTTVTHLLLRRFWLLIGMGLFCAVVSIAVSFFFPLEYRADGQVFIVSRSRYGVDPYTVVKSAERIGENIVEIVKTNDFFQKVMTTPGFTFDQSRFQNISERDKRKEWQKAVETSVVYGTGMLNVSAYSTVPGDAESLAGAALKALEINGANYVGGNVTLSIVNAPVVTRFPARPNLPLNAGVGFVAGVCLAAVFAVRRDYHLS